MQNTNQIIDVSTPRRIFPLSPEMVRRLRRISASQVRKVRKPIRDQEQAA